ncbi:MAG TPA: class I SAM-dependent methyltransferase [Cytophagales bacterium]|nr:class I SAM-dependent methyltransferase [Cytophagales bacterium]
MNCRHCNNELKHVFVDLVNCPPSNAMLKQEQLNEPEKYYPLKIFVCDNCYLVQVDEIAKASDIFDGEYTYFSSFSTSWLAHAKRYVDMMMERFSFGKDSQIIEIASNDGYLLQYFKEYGVPVLGVDPTANTAEVAKQKGIDTMVDFFGSDLASKHLADKGIKGDLILGNNVLAHVPDINDLVKGMKLALKDNGVVTMEFPHLLKLVEEAQFDTIYHEHFSYLSFTTVKRIFESQGLEMFDVEEIPTHGGSLRIFAKHQDDNSKGISPNVQNLLKKEFEAGITSIDYYLDFQQRVDKIKYSFLEFLIEQRRKGKKIIGYGAAAKGNTLINYAGLKGNDLIQFVVDASPYKQNKYLPGSHIPVVSKEMIAEYKPDYVIILPWNLKEEISEQFAYIEEWGGKFVVFVPEFKICSSKVLVLS